MTRKLREYSIAEVERRISTGVNPQVAQWTNSPRGREVVKRGWKALVRELGYVRAIMYCLVFSEGDLTVARRAWGSRTIDEMLADLTDEEKAYTGDETPGKDRPHVKRTRRTQTRKDRS